MTDEQLHARGLSDEVIEVLRSELGRKWVRTESIDPADRSKRVVFVIYPKPNDPSKIQIDEVPDSPTLAIHCGKYLEVMLLHIGPLQPSSLKVSFDDGPVHSEKWNPAREALLSPAPTALARKLLAAKTFRVEYTLKGKPATSLLYNMADLPEIFPREPVCTSKLK
jgi:hypothetical protein